MDSEISLESVTSDLSPQHDRPGWLLSSYGPSKYQPTLIGGLDLSPEEMRVKALEAVKSGNIQQYLAYETAQITTAEQKFNDAKANIQPFFDHARKNENNPNTASTYVFMTPTFGSASSAFGTPANASAFRKPTGFGAFAGNSSSPFGGVSATNPSGSAFGKSAFSQPSQAAPSAFGAPQATSVFGQPSQPTSAFSQPNQTQGFSAFGKPAQGTSAFGQPSQPSSAFVQASQQPTSAFGQPAQASSAFGQPPQPTSAFGSNQSGPSGFGQPPQPISAFGQSGFGQSPQPQSSVLKPASGAFGSAGGSGAFGVNPTGSGGFSVFAGQPSAFGLGAGQSNNSNPSNALSSNPAFGQSSFGGNAPAGAPGVQQSAFGAPSAFGAAIQPASTGAFGAPAPVSAFAQPASAFGSVAAPQSAFGSAGAQPQSVFGSNTTTATPSSFVTAQPTQAPLPPKPKSTMPDFANFKARYQPGLNKYDDLLPQNYLQLLPKAAREAFESATFEWGKIPEWIPPKELR